jgi:dihydroxy-acid dehydratase
VATIPAVLADRLRHAETAGGRAVAMAAEGLTPDRIMTPTALANGLRILLAIGGSTNGIVHLAAVAGRLGIEIEYQAFDKMGRETPVLIDLKPSGQYYMDDLHKAGGMAPIFQELKRIWSASLMPA